MSMLYLWYARKPSVSHREWQLRSCVESEKHDLIVGLITHVILDRKTQGAGTRVTSSGRREQQKQLPEIQLM